MKNNNENTEILRRELENSSRQLFGGENAKLLLALRSKLPDLLSAYVVDWIPEQGEDIYTVIVGQDLVAVVEIDRLSAAREPLVDVYTLEEYRKEHASLSQERRRKLAVALELIKKSQST